MKSVAGNEDLVLAELDSVLDSHQGNEATLREQQQQQLAAAATAARANPNSSGSSSGKSSGEAACRVMDLLPQ